jgi:hypothetical protein
MTIALPTRDDPRSPPGAVDRVVVAGEVTRGVGLGVGGAGMETVKLTASRKLPTEGLPEPVLTVRNANRVHV